MPAFPLLLVKLAARLIDPLSIGHCCSAVAGGRLRGLPQAAQEDGARWGTRRPPRSSTEQRRRRQQRRVFLFPYPLAPFPLLLPFLFFPTGLRPLPLPTARILREGMTSQHRRENRVQAQKLFPHHHLLKN